MLMQLHSNIKNGKQKERKDKEATQIFILRFSIKFLEFRCRRFDLNLSTLFAKHFGFKASSPRQDKFCEGKRLMRMRAIAIDRFKQSMTL